MRSKAPLTMMEQLIMLLVFALAAALCLQAFVMADQMSERNARRDAAILSVQHAAETVKACSGDLVKAQSLLGGKQTGDTLTVDCEEGLLTIALLPTEHAYLGSAHITMTDIAGDELFSVTTAWQTGGGA